MTKTNTPMIDEAMYELDLQSQLEQDAMDEDVYDDDNEEEEYDDYDSYEPDDCWGDYGRSGEKYGWYNGFSDDVIDDAFEGDPEATWNVD